MLVHEPQPPLPPVTKESPPAGKSGVHSPQWADGNGQVAVLTLERAVGLFGLKGSPELSQQDHISARGSFLIEHLPKGWDPSGRPLHLSMAKGYLGFMKAVHHRALSNFPALIWLFQHGTCCILQLGGADRKGTSLVLELYCG